MKIGRQQASADDGDVWESAGTDNTDRHHGAGSAPQREHDALQVARDEELMQRLAAGEPDALGPLYGRYGRLVYAVASQSVDRSAAEELVQEVFLVVWRKAASFDPARGTFRNWLLEIAHSRILNELRRRSRRPVLLHGGDDQLRLRPDPDPEPSETIEREHRERVIREALATLPTPQQQALWLAYFADLTHEQVAITTAVPLGTAKTRIRSGLRRLRSRLNPLLVGSLGVVLVIAAAKYAHEHEQAARTARALRHVTFSDLHSFRLIAPGETPRDAHGVYRARVGADLIVLTVSYLPALAEGEVYQAWASINGSWRTLGIVTATGPEGRGLLVSEGGDLGELPGAVVVTRELSGGAQTPSENIVIVWPPVPPR